MIDYFTIIYKLRQQLSGIFYIDITGQKKKVGSLLENSCKLYIIVQIVLKEPLL